MSHVSTHLARSAVMSFVGAVVLLASASRSEALYAKSTITQVADGHYELTEQTTLSSCDNCTRWVNLPFTFRYYGTPYTAVLVSTDGWVAFEDPGINLTTNYKFEYNRTSATSVPMIAPYWDDLDPALGGDVRYGQVGSHFTISWSAKHHTGGNEVWFQLKLFDVDASGQNKFEIHYNVTNHGNAAYNNGKSATVGYQAGALLGVATHIYHEQANVTAGTAWRFTPYRKPAFIAAVDLRGKLRGGINYIVPSDCLQLSAQVQTSASGWVVAEMPATMPYPCNPLSQTFWATPQLVPDPTYSKAKMTTLGANNAQYSAGVAFVQSYLDRGLTPASTLTQNLPSGGKLVWWDDGVPNYAILIVPGFDPLNENSPYDIFAQVGDLAAQLVAEGWDVAIPEFANPGQGLAGFQTEMNDAVEKAKVRSISARVQAIGISMGGVILRQYLWLKGSAANTKVRTSYFVDSPLTGANLGSPTKGMITLATCYRQGEPDDTTINSAPARQMAFVHRGSCTCKTDGKKARDSSCVTQSVDHDSYYNSLGWYKPPTTANTERFAYSFSDGFGTLTYGAGGGLFKFQASGSACVGFSAGNWDGNQRDCAPGSRYIRPSDVNTYEEADYLWSTNLGICQGGGVTLGWDPSFVNLDSALGFNVTQWDANVTNTTCTPPAGALPIWANVSAATVGAWSAPANYFNGRLVNSVNGRHDAMPPALGTDLYARIYTSGTVTP